jgi:hypothetical protein
MAEDLNPVCFEVRDSAVAVMDTECWWRDNIEEIYLI